MDTPLNRVSRSPLVQLRNGWYLTPDCGDGYQHYMPYTDTYAHVEDEECWCSPVMQKDGYYYHQAHDKRELYYLGLKKPS